MRRLILALPITFSLVALATSCSDPVHCCNEDADAEVDLVEYDVAEFVEPWDGPLAINVFSSSASASSSSGYSVLTDFNGGVIIMVQPGERNVWAQRISADGELLWTESGVPVTSDVAFEWMGHDVRGMEKGAISDREGGAYILYNVYHLDEWFIMGNHVFGDGTLLYPAPLFERAIHGPHDELESKRMGHSIVFHNMLFLNLWLDLWISLGIPYPYEDEEYLLENGLKNYCPFLVDSLFENAPAELQCLGTALEPLLLRLDDTSVIYFSTSYLYIEDGQLKPPDYGGRRAGVRYNILDENLLSLTSGEVVFIDTSDSAIYLSMGNDRAEFDRPGEALFLYHHKSNRCIIKHIVSADGVSYDWRIEDGIGAAAGETYSARGDGRGGLYIAGKREVKDEDCLEIECCSVEFDGCDTELWVQLLDPLGTPVFPEPSTTVEAYPLLDASRQNAYWDPAPVFARSIDDEPDGNAIYFWRKPLVHEGSTYPDAFGYDLGYVICAQKATPESPGAWGDGGCIPVARVLSEYDDLLPYSWYQAVDDGEGGAFVVFHDRNADEITDYVRAQHVSSSGQLLWNDLDGP